MEENKNNKKKILILGILLVIVTIGVLGITYAAYNFQREGDSNELIAGDIYMHYKGKNAGISIDNAVPSKTYDKEKYFEFTIDGKNTYTEKDIWYEIDLVEGDQPDGRKTRIDDKYLRFTLTEKIGTGSEKTVVNSVGYDDITNKKIWVNKIDKNTTEETKITYKLYMWISDEVHIGYDDTEEISSDYTVDEWNSDIYASVKINVKGDFIEKEIDAVQYNGISNMIDAIKGKAYSNIKEVIMLDVTDKSNVTKCASVKACAEKEKVEYRYSGSEVNNYIYLKDNNNSNELWRIIGIFEDETAGQYVKIVRDSILPESYLPATFKASNGSTYKIQYTSEPWRAYWNNLTGTSSDKNNWSTAGLQYYLNAEQETGGSTYGYLHYLSENTKQQLVDVKQYLGTHGYNRDNTLQSYTNERDVESCAGGKGPTGNTSGDTINSNKGCQVWAGNDATWTGKVSLMYPSDYGFAAAETYWGTKKLYEYNDSAVKASNWMMSTMETSIKYSWLLSPSSRDSGFAAYWYSTGSVTGDSLVYNYYYGIRPVLNLSSSTSIVGDGTKNNPYKIVE